MLWVTGCLNSMEIDVAGIMPVVHYEARRDIYPLLLLFGQPRR
jgi:hypothetical protein